MPDIDTFDDLAPFSCAASFIDADYDLVVSEVIRWREERGRPFRSESLFGPVQDLVRALEPWAVPWWKELLVETWDGRWVALLSQSQDMPTFSYLAHRLQRRVVRTQYFPHVVRNGEVVGYGDVTFELIDGARTDIGPQRMVRVVEASYQDRWEWYADGEPQPFEDPTLYRKRRIRDRLTVDTLNTYCAALEIDRATLSFYGPRATLIELDHSSRPQPPRTMSGAAWRRLHL